MEDENKLNLWSSYNSDYAKDHEKMNPESYWEFKEIFKLYKPSYDDEILEIGCNTGEFCYLINDKFKVSPVGVDINNDAIDLALKKYPDLNFQNKDLFELEGKYDAIYMQHVIEHIENPVEALKKLRNNLKKDGKLIITCPNNWAYLLKFIAWTQKQKFCYDPSHYHEFSPRSIIKTIKKANYNPIKLFTKPLGVPFINRVFPNSYYSMPSFYCGGHIFLIVQK